MNHSQKTGAEDGKTSKPTAANAAQSYTEIGCPATISLRDYFAAKAMQVILHPANDRVWDADVVAREAFSVADAMIAEREKGGQ